jgi:DNA-binding transcriptional MerR regulator/effector-binding domain-containing protein
MRAMTPPLVTIGRFSQLTGLTMRALRLYDELGLVRPEAVDSTSRYRYYTIDQIERAALVGRLRRIDMPLEEIGLFLDGEASERERTLASHRSRLVQRADSVSRAIRTLDEISAEVAAPDRARQRRLTSMVLQTLKDQPVMRIRMDLRQEDLRASGIGPDYELPGQDQPRDWRTCVIWKHARLSEIDPVVEHQDLRLAGPPYVLCAQPDDDGALQAELGWQVDRAGVADGRVEPAVLPGSNVATMFYTGRADTVGVLYRQLWAEMTKAGLEPAGEPRELLMTNPQATPDPEDNWTQLIWPVKG